MERKLFEFHFYIRISPRAAQILFDFFNLNWATESGSYYMPVAEDAVGSFDEAYKLRKNGEADLLP